MLHYTLQKNVDMPTGLRTGSTSHPLYDQVRFPTTHAVYNVIC